MQPSAFVHRGLRMAWTTLLASLVGVLVTSALTATAIHAGAAAQGLTVVATSPADGQSVPVSPAVISVTFNQTIGSAATVVIACNGNPGPGTSPAVSADLLSLTVDLARTPLPKGTCDVRWSVQAIDEQGARSGSFSFQIQQDTVTTVASAAATGPQADATTASTAAGGAAAGPSTDAETTGTSTSGTGESAGSADLGGPLGLARLVSNLSIAILLGALLLITVAWPEGVEYILTIRFLRLTWVTAVASTAVEVICMRAQHEGSSFGGSISPTTWTDLTDTTPGIAALARVVLVVAIGWVAIRPDRVIDPATQPAALAIPALAVATLGFSRSGGDLVLLGYAFGVAHALAMAVWLGGLVLLGRVVLAGPGEDDLVHAVRGFARMATKAMIATVITGAFLAWRLDRGHVTATTHGRLLVLKVIVVVAMVVIARATRQFVRDRLARAEVMTSPLASRLRRAVGFEAALGVLVLAITAWMLSAQPGNLVASARSSGDFAQQLTFTGGTTLDAKLSLDPARVGRNELLLELFQPSADVSQIVVEFVPPAAATAAHPVTLTISELSGAGAAHLQRSIGLPLDAAGPWSVTMAITTASGVVQQSALLNVRSDGSTDGAPLPSVESTPVTAAGAVPATTAATPANTSG